MRSIARSTILVGLLLCAVSGVFAQQAVIKELTGTVEIKRASSALWETAAQGQTITGDTTISTGFKSMALIAIGNSVLTVRPLTRLTLAEISATQGTETINVSLQAGRVRADITPPSGAKGIYKVQSPIATASVRGTIFEIDTYTLLVIKGAVEFKGTSGVSVVVDAGRISTVDEKTGRAALPEQTIFTALDPELPIGSSILNPFDAAAAQGIKSIEIVGLIDYQ